MKNSIVNEIFKFLFILFVLYLEQNLFFSLLYDNYINNVVGALIDYSLFMFGIVVLINFTKTYYKKDKK